MARTVTLESVWGQLTVIREAGVYTEPNGKQRRKVYVRCLCGNEFECPTSYLLRGTTTRCRDCSAMGKRVVQIGQVFDQLTVVGFSKSRGYAHDTAVCQCSCSNTIQVRSPSLLKNKTNNCGCKVRGLWKGHGDLSKSYFSHVRHGAKTRELDFEITMETLWKMFEQQEAKCALTGLPIKLGRHHEMTGSLDRIDSARGYSVDNVQWVHKDVNKMKMDLDEPRFIELCTLIASRNSLATSDPSGPAQVSCGDRSSHRSTKH